MVRSENREQPGRADYKGVLVLSSSGNRGKSGHVEYKCVLVLSYHTDYDFLILSRVTV